MREAITVALVGAGSMVFTRQVVSDLLAMPELRDRLSLSLVDRDGERLGRALAMVQRMMGEAGAEATVRASLDRAQGLAGADFAIVTIQVGGHRATELDFAIPARYGLRQTIADTVGVGGIFRGLRTVPAILEICRDVERVAPRARLLNYTNPMGMVMLAVGRLTGVEGYGLCHSVPHTARALAGYLGVAPERLTYRAAGVNHQAWFLTLEVDGRDAYPDLAQAARRGDVYRQDPVRFELFARLGVFVSESSEHNAEYVPYFLPWDQEVRRLAIPVGEYLRRSARNLEAFAELGRALDTGAPLLLPPSDEYAPRLVRALAAGEADSVYVNVPNQGWVENLSAHAAVEVPAVADGAGVRPLPMGALPTALAALNGPAIHVQQLVLEAVQTGRWEAVEEAVMLDPNACASLTLDGMARMVDELVEAHRPYLPPLKRHRAWALAALEGGGPRPPAPSGEGRAPGAGELLLREFLPVSRLEVASHRVERARVPVVDLHNHSQWAGEGWEVADVPALVAEMDAAGVAAMVDLDGGMGERVARHLDHFRGPYPDRFAVFASIDWRRYREYPDFGERLARDLRQAAATGAEGLKVWKELGLRLRDREGRRLATCDPRLDPLWETAGELGLPVVIHTGDPVAFFTPLDRYNERYEELVAHPDWHVYGPEFPSFRQIQEEFEALVAAHPRTTFIGAHVASYAENLQHVAGLLDRYPNLYVDLAARHAELGRQPYTARRFLEAYAGRTVFGLDHWPATAEDYRVVFRVLETEDDFFDYRPPTAPPDPGAQGRWKVYGLNLSAGALRAIYHGTAVRLLPRLRQAVERMGQAAGA